eukprot:1830114-Rhodomonas_salina.4
MYSRGSTTSSCQYNKSYQRTAYADTPQLVGELLGGGERATWPQHRSIRFMLRGFGYVSSGHRIAGT